MKNTYPYSFGINAYHWNYPCDVTLWNILVFSTKKKKNPKHPLIFITPGIVQGWGLVPYSSPINTEKDNFLTEWGSQS